MYWLKVSSSFKKKHNSIEKPGLHTFGGLGIFDNESKELGDISSSIKYTP